MSLHLIHLICVDTSKVRRNQLLKVDNININGHNALMIRKHRICLKSLIEMDDEKSKVRLFSRLKGETMFD